MLTTFDVYSLAVGRDRQVPAAQATSTVRMTLSPASQRVKGLQSLLQIHPGEGRLVALLVSLYLVLGASFVFVQTMAFGLFVTEFGPQGLPYSYLATAVLASLVAFVYLKLSEHVSFSTLLTVNLGFLTAGCALFWFGLASPAGRWFIFLLPIWFQILVNLGNLAVWPLAGRLFDLRQGKRLFGLVGSGVWIANLVGGFLVAPLVAALGTVNLLMLAAASLIVALSILRVILRSYAGRLVPAAGGRPTVKAQPAPSLLQNRYVVLIFAYVFLWWVAFFFQDIIFFDRAAVQYPDAGQLAGFIGLLVSAMGALALVTTTFLTSRVMGRYGLRAGLLTQPVLVTAGMAGLALAGTVGGAVGVLFWLAALSKLVSAALGFSLSQSAYVICYQPLPADQRGRIQTMADGIVQPVAIGVAGVALLVLNTVLNLGAVGLSYVFLAISAGLILVVLLLARQYPVALSQAVAKRRLGEAAISVVDSSSLEVLQDSLRNPYPGAVIYALDMLEQLDYPSLATAVPQLLNHRAPEVRREAFQRIERLEVRTALGPVRERLAVETVPEVREAALRALAMMGEAGAFTQVVQALDDPEPHARRGALVGLLRHGGIDGILAAGQTLSRLVDSPDPGERAVAAQVLGEAGVTRFCQSVRTLLHDANAGVRRAALRAAGKIRHPELWPAVVEACAASEVGRAALSALVAGGEAALAEIEAAFARPDQPRDRLMVLARACGRIRGARVLRLLQDKIAFPDAEVRTFILGALSACGYRAASQTEVHRQIQAEVAQSAWTTAALADLGDDDRVALAAAALKDALAQARDRAFFLLSFLFNAEAIVRAREALTRGFGAQQAYALEILDTQLPAEMKPALLPLFEDLRPAERLVRWKAAFRQATQSREERLSAIVVGPQATWFTLWARACALYAMGSLSATACEEAVAEATSAPEPLVRETAQWALARLRPSDQKGDAAVLSTIEKVIILKTVSVFSQTPDDVLAEVATLLEEVQIAQGETIFAKGDLGDSLYVIVDGKVRAHDGERLLNYLSERDVFGEMALLDPEPRMASVTATEPTRLLRLAQTPFYELMAERPEVATGIIRVLTRHLRARVRDLAQQEARVE